MIEHLNAGHIALVVSLALMAERFLRLVAPMTSTLVDDDAVKAIDSARAWARDKAPLFYVLVEQAQEIGRIVSKKDKPAAFDAEIAQAYQAVFGKPLPAQALEEARVVTKGMAAADKLALPAPVTITKPTAAQVEQMAAALATSICNAAKSENTQNPLKAPSL